MVRSPENLAAPPAPGQEAPPEAASGGSLPVGRILRIPLRRWKLSLLFLAVSAGIGLAVVTKFKTHTWQSEGSLIYKEVAVSEGLKDAYRPPSLQLALVLLKSDIVYERLTQDLNLPMPPRALRSMFKVGDDNRVSERIPVSLNWGDPEDGAKLVNRFMDLFAAHLNGMWQEELKKDIDGREEPLAEKQKQAEQRLKEKDQALRGPDGEDIRSLYDALQKDVAEAQKELELQIRARDKAVEDGAKWQELYKRALARGSDDAALGEIANNADYQVQKKGLQDAIRNSENALTLKDKDYRAKDARYRKLKPLEGKAVPKEEITLLREDAEKLYAEIKIIRKDLEEDRKKLPKLAQDFARRKVDEAKNAKKVAEDEIARLKDSLARKQQEKKKLDEPIRTAERLAQEYDLLVKERQKLQDQLQDLRNLWKRNLSYFIVEATAKPAKEPLGSNAKKLMGLGFGIPLVVLFGLMVVWDLSAGTGITGAELAGRLGLPVLAGAAPTAGGRPTLSANDARGLALRLRQYVPDPGSVLLFSSLNAGAAADDLVRNVSRYLAMRDEKVLIIDARLADAPAGGVASWVEETAPVLVEQGAAGGPHGELEPDDPASTGLVQYLVFEGQDPAGFIWPSRVPAVDFLPSGGPYPISDVLASQPMRDLLEGMAKRYSLILLLGPPLTNFVDTEILAAYAQGVTVLLNQPYATFSPAAVEFARSLREANVPLLGAVVYP